MKKVLLVLLAISMMVTFTACGSSNGSENKETVSEDEEWVSGQYTGMDFSYPSGCEFSEEDGYAFISIVPSDKNIFIYPQEMSEDEVDSYRSAALSSFRSSFENVTEEETYDLTVDGLDAVGETAVVDYNGWHLYCKLVFVYNEKSGYFYTIEYTSTTDTEEDTSLYESFIDSVSFE